MPAIDPPIIVTGGGGDVPGIKKSARNYVSIDYQPDSGGRKKIKSKKNKATNITGVKVEFNTTPPGSQPPITLTGLSEYNIQITFITDDEPLRASNKKEKTAAKSPTARKGKSPSKRK